MKLGEFFVDLLVNSDQKELDDFTQGVSELDKTLSQLKVAAVTLAIKAFTDATVDAAVSVQNFTNQTGLLGERLQKWQVAAELSDITLGAEQVAQSIAGLEQNLAQIRLGGGNVSPFQLLGIDVADKNAFQVLEQVRSSIQGLDSATATNLITQLGLTPQFINVLRLSRKEFEGLFGDRALLGKDKRDDVVAMGTSFADLRLRIVALKDQIVAAFAPALTAISNGLGKFVERVTRTIDKISDLSEYIKAIGVVVGLAVVRFVPIVKVLTAVGLVIDDLLVALEGGDSIIGRFGDAVVKMATSVVDTLRAPFKMISDFIDKINDFFGKDGASSKFSDFKVTGDLVNALTPDLPSGGRLMTNNINNTYNINSSADANSIARGITTSQQRELNYAEQNYNNGFAY